MSERRLGNYELIIIDWMLLYFLIVAPFVVRAVTGKWPEIAAECGFAFSTVVLQQINNHSASSSRAEISRVDFCSPSSLRFFGDRRGVVIHIRSTLTRWLRLFRRLFGFVE